MLYLGVATSIHEKVKIIQALSRSMNLDAEVDLEQIAATLPPNFTGADFSALTTEAYMTAVQRRIEELEVEISDFKKEQNIPVEDELLPETYLKLKYPNDSIESKSLITITQDDFNTALQKVVPSISMEELTRYEQLREKYSSNQK